MCFTGKYKKTNLELQGARSKEQLATSNAVRCAVRWFCRACGGACVDVFLHVRIVYLNEWFGKGNSGQALFNIVRRRRRKRGVKRSTAVIRFGRTNVVLEPVDR